MKINDVQLNADVLDILTELQTQLHVNNINLINKIKDGPDNVQICCPYHKNGQERRPSAGVRKSDGKFHCFSCGTTKDLPEVISYCFGKDELSSFGWQWLLNNFAVVEKEARQDVALNLNRDICVTERLEYVSEEELDSYRYSHPYMYKRGLTDDIVELFDIGYDSNTDCITFPIRDIQGNTLFVARRSVKTKFFNYPQGVEKPLYGLYELSYAYNFDIGNYPDEVIVTESMLDALSFWTIDKCAVALNGLGNELQFKQLRDLPCRKLILATDNDDAGMKARKRIRQNVKNKIITEVIFPEGRKDANECTKEELMNLEEIF